MKIVSLILFIAFVSMTCFAQTDELNIIPKPLTIRKLDGEFRLTKRTKIVTSSQNGRVFAAAINRSLLRDFGFQLEVVAKTKDRNGIFILTDIIDRLPSEAEKYTLVIDTDHVEIAGEKAGAFYAVQSLLQLMRAGPQDNEVLIPVSAIVDQPRFPYRGMHLDVSRHFFPVEFVKKYIDLMSQYKFNYFHWHLTDDQGWRIEIKKYPKLTEIGSKRPESHLGPYTTTFKGDGVPVEGFYTQEQIKDVVAYAKARYITVIPEIELPGHSSAALAAYPELSCKADYKYEVKKTWGIFKEVYCPTEKTFGFLEDVLSEVIGLFPDSPYIHVGGDEVLKDMWKESPEVKELMARENLKDEHEVQSYFIRRMEKFINSKGKKIIGWDEILEGGLAPNATVMSWRGTKGGIEAARAHHDVIMTPTDYAYFDFSQGDPATEPINIGNYLTLDKVYSFDPVPKDLSPDDAKYIIGGQGNVWTEYMQTPEKVEYMVFPRLLAMAENVWSTPENKNFADFSRRLSAQFVRLDKQNVNYRIPEPEGLQNTIFPLGNEKLELINGIAFRSQVKDSRIFFTTDGTDPTELSTEYKGGRIDIILRPNQVVTVKTIVVLSSGRKSSVYTATLLRRDMFPSVELAEKRPGVTYGIVSWRTDGVPEPLVTSGETKSLGIQQFAKIADLKKPFAVTFNGYFNALTDGLYEFQVESTYSTAVELDGLKLIDETGTSERKTRSNVVPLRAGLHKISLRYANSSGDAFWRVRWAIKGQNWRNLGGGELIH